MKNPIFFVPNKSIFRKKKKSRANTSNTKRKEKDMNVRPKGKMKWDRNNTRAHQHKMRRALSLRHERGRIPRERDRHKRQTRQIKTDRHRQATGEERREGRRGRKKIKEWYRSRPNSTGTWCFYCCTTEYTIPVPRNSRSRILMSDVNLCALVERFPRPYFLFNKIK